MSKLTGRCLCGAVTYECERLGDEVLACHCNQCARTSGHHAVMAEATNIVITDPAAHLRSYRSSPNVERGFCGECGGNLFWRDLLSGAFYVTLGTVDRPTGVRISRHIFVGSKSDYYTIDDPAPQSDEW